MNPLKQLINKLLIVKRILEARRMVPGLYMQANENSRRLWRALRNTLEFNLCNEEKEWIRRIESLRKKLRASNEVITRTIYGLPPECPEPKGMLTAEGRIVTETIGQVCRRASRQYFWCLFLFKLIREFRPVTGLELGTSLGISAAYQAAALKLNQIGRLTTLEGDPKLSSLAGRHFQALGLKNVELRTGRFQDTLSAVLARESPVHYVFFDGGKNEAAVLKLFEEIYPHLADRAVLVFDDIHWSREMEHAWQAIEKDERVNLSVDLLALGACLIDRHSKRKEKHNIPIG